MVATSTRTKLGPDFRRLWTASSVSVVGDGVRLAAMPLLAAAISPTPGAVSLVTMAGAAPWLVFSLFGGALADRFDRRTLMWRVDLVRAVLIAAFAVWVLLAHPALIALIVITFLLGCGETVFDNASTSFLPEIVPPAQLDRANGHLQGAQILGFQFLGPVAGSALFAVAASGPFLVDAVSFAVAAVLMLTLKRARSAPKTDTKPVMAEIGEGLRWLWTHRGMRLLAAVFGLSGVALTMGTTMLVLLLINALHAPEAAYGLVLGAGAVGGILASVGAGWLRDRLGLRLSIAVALLVLGASLVVTGLSGSTLMVAALYAVGSFGVVTWNIQVVSLRQRVVPSELLGRVNSAYQLIGRGGGLLGAALSGVLGSAIGVRAPLLIGGALILLCLAAVPRLGDLNAVADEVPA
jgi:MFS family permease